jgi:hypothetical protein
MELSKLGGFGPTAVERIAGCVVETSFQIVGEGDEGIWRVALLGKASMPSR